MKPSEARRNGSTPEDGVAMIWALMLLLIATGVIVVMAMVTMNGAKETRSANSYSRGAYWVEAANSDLVARSRRADLGPWVSGSDNAGNLFLQLRATDRIDPGAPSSPTGVDKNRTTRFAIPGTNDYTAIPIMRTTADGSQQRGWYQVLPIRAKVSAASPPALSPAWNAVYVRDPARPGDQGSIEMNVRVWSDGIDQRAVVGRLELRQGSISRYSILSQDPFVLGGLGSLTLGARVHSNNSDVSVPAVAIGAGVNLSTVDTITSTRGAITGCNNPSKCSPNVRDTVPFGSGTDAMRTVASLARLAGNCTPGAFAACTFTSGAGMPTTPAGFRATPIGQLPVWVANIATGSGGRCVDVGYQTYSMRADMGAYPMLNDFAGPTSGLTSVGTYCPAPGGGALLFDGDVIVRGMRPDGAAGVTIMAQRSAGFPQRTPPGRSAAGRVTVPASIFLHQTSNGAGIGARNSLAPVGLVAQGGIYLPSWPMRTDNRNMLVHNVSAMAVGGGISYGGSIITIAGDGEAPGLGLTLADARLRGYGYGDSLDFRGSLASGGRLVFRAGTNDASHLGYRQRSIAYVDSLIWNPPPLFPAEQDWHVASWKAFRSQ